jgi:hypothetical protein
MDLRAIATLAGVLAAMSGGAADVPGDLARFRVTGDGIQAIGGAVGDADRGRR